MPPGRRPGRNQFGFYRLEGTSGDHLISKERCVLGRHSESSSAADINVSKHTACSRTHAAIEWDEDKRNWIITPLKKNSVFVNERRRE